MAQQKILLFWEIYNDLKQKVESSLVANEENCLHMCDECHKLTQLVSELAASLSSYELRRAQTGIIELQAKIAEIKNSSKPLKEPFKFKRVAQAVPNNLAADKSTVKNVAGINSGENPSPAFSGLKNQTRTIDLEEASASNKDLWLDDLENCYIVIKGSPSSLHVTRLSSCHIVGADPVHSTVFFESCKNSVFALSCQQFRCHRSVACDFYLSVRSRPIIEDCSSCRFAPYGDCSTQNEKSGEFLDPPFNKWSLVDDFNWLSKDPSPNWSILPVESRIH